MQRPSLNRTLAAGVLGTALLGGCASAPPNELKTARSALEQAQASAAKDWTPAKLHEAERTLQLAEATFRAEGSSQRARDRAYVAMRRAQLAEVEGRTLQARRRLEELQNQMAHMRATKLDQLRDGYAEQQAELEAVERARLAAEQARAAAERRAERLTQDLAEVAQVREEPRGTVVTLSGSVLFASGESELFPAGKERLRQVARSLTERAKGTSVVVEGHTDTQGSQELNLELSRRRAEAVKEFLVQQGVPSDRIQAKGLGFSQPIAPNKTAEGRANNRRVEIVLEPHSAGGARQTTSPLAEGDGKAQG